ncbi:MAG: hypothetical protein KDA41_19025, partial [Planctomycetales bacterium]|nr:hypothetical protein [Planctomycetales bacterium]
SVVQAAVGSGISAEDKMALIRRVLEKGKPAARKVAAAALVEMEGVEATRLVLLALRDDDPHVQAAALGQLRPRGVPGALGTLFESLDSLHAPVIEAARAALSEFNFARYYSGFDAMDEVARRTTGDLVRRVDPQSAGKLREELQASVRSRRMRGVAMTAAMGLAEELEEDLVLLLQDEDHILRAEVAAVLADCNTQQTRLALREALLDTSVAVQDAAQRSLEDMAAGPKTEPAAAAGGAP